MITFNRTREQHTAVLLEKIAGHVELQVRGDLRADEDTQARKRHVDSQMPPYASTLSSYSDELIQELYEAVTSGLRLGDSITTLLYFGESASFLQEFIRFSPLMKNTPTLQRLISAVRPLHSYSQLAPSENYASCDPAIATQVEALCIVTNALLGYRENYRTEPEARSWVPLEFVQVEGLLSYYARSDDRVIMLSDDGLIDLIISRPTDAEIIASTMISRKTADSSLIQLILENDARPLSDGII